MQVWYNNIIIKVQLWGAIYNMDDTGYLIGLIIGALFIGAASGALPLFLGIKKGKKGLGWGGFAACLVGGFIWGIRAALPICILFTVLILILTRKKKPAAPYGDVNSMNQAQAYPYNNLTATPGRPAPPAYPHGNTAAAPARNTSYAYPNYGTAPNNTNKAPYTAPAAMNSAVNPAMNTANQMPYTRTAPVNASGTANTANKVNTANVSAAARVADPANHANAASARKKGVRPYKGNDAYIFFSYSHKDTKEVLEVIGQLQASGYKVWFDEGITPGSEWDENIAHHIDASAYFIGYITKNYVDSQNCRDELNYARDLDKDRLLVYGEEVVLPKGMQMRMNRLQAIHRSRYPEPESFYEKLFNADGIEKCKR